MLPIEVSVQEAPESVEVHKLPTLSAATSFVPSAEEATDLHFCVLPIEVSSVQEPPESVEIHKLPLKGAATSFVPSAEEATERQAFVLPIVSSVNVTLLFVHPRLLPAAPDSN